MYEDLEQSVVDQGGSCRAEVDTAANAVGPTESFPAPNSDRRVAQPNWAALGLAGSWDAEGRN